MTLQRCWQRKEHLPSSMVTVQVCFRSHFKELAGTTDDSFDLEQATVGELASKICSKYGSKMQALLIDPETNGLNERGTMFVNSKGMRVSIEDELKNGEIVTFLVGIAGG